MSLDDVAPAVAASGRPSPVQFPLDLSKQFHEAWQLLYRGREPPLTCGDSIQRKCSPMTCVNDPGRRVS
jgi:hypothetical protein